MYIIDGVNPIRELVGQIDEWNGQYLLTMTLQYLMHTDDGFISASYSAFDTKGSATAAMMAAYGSIAADPRVTVNHPF